METLIGVDLGTTNIKAVAYDTSGMVLAEHSMATPSTVQGTRQAIIDPQVLWQTAARCLAEIIQQLRDPGAIVGVAIASVGEAGVPLDRSGEPLYPIITWYDERSAPQALCVSQQLGDKRIYQATGLPPGHTYSVLKLLWLQEHEPDVVRQLDCWLSVGDWITFCLCGQKWMGYSQASRTMALNLAQRTWWHAGLAELGLRADTWPQLAAEGVFAGAVTVQAAAQTGLRQGTPVYLGGHDHVCGALASGAIKPGIVLDSTGTTEAELTTIEQVSSHLAAADLSFCLGCHVARQTYYITGGILGAGSLIGWLAELLWPSQEYTRIEALESLSKLAAQSPPGASGLYLLPHLAGAGSPDRSSTARGVISGLALTHNRSDLARAAIEGLAFELRTLWESLVRHTDQPLERAIITGGGARNMLWNQIKADITGMTLQTPSSVEAVTRGAALLVGLGAGIYQDESQALAQTRQAMQIITPEPKAQRFYETHFREYISQIRPQAVHLGRLAGQLLLK
ncbi:MAG: FGGY-family carbohydrate kinase [Anaerolineae bacterium]